MLELPAVHLGYCARGIWFGLLSWPSIESRLFSRLLSVHIFLYTLESRLELDSKAVSSRVQTHIPSSTKVLCRQLQAPAADVILAH